MPVFIVCTFVLPHLLLDHPSGPYFISQDPSEPHHIKCDRPHSSPLFSPPGSRNFGAPLTLAQMQACGCFTCPHPPPRPKRNTRGFHPYSSRPLSPCVWSRGGGPSPAPNARRRGHLLVFSPSQLPLALLTFCRRAASSRVWSKGGSLRCSKSETMGVSLFANPSVAPNVLPLPPLPRRHPVIPIASAWCFLAIPLPAASSDPLPPCLSCAHASGDAATTLAPPFKKFARLLNTCTPTLTSNTRLGDPNTHALNGNLGTSYVFLLRRLTRLLRRSQPPLCILMMSPCSTSNNLISLASSPPSLPTAARPPEPLPPPPPPPPPPPLLVRSSHELSNETRDGCPASPPSPASCPYLWPLPVVSCAAARVGGSTSSPLFFEISSRRRGIRPCSWKSAS